MEKDLFLSLNQMRASGDTFTGYFMACDKDEIEIRKSLSKTDNLINVSTVALQEKSAPETRAKRYFRLKQERKESRRLRRQSKKEESREDIGEKTDPELRKSAQKKLLEDMM